MRIAVSGKGGSGKTTIAGMLARILAGNGHKVLAIDADPNPNMALAMGVSREQAARINVIPRSMAHWLEDDQGQPYVHLEMPLDRIATQYGLGAPDGIRLLVTGQIEEAGAGCMCQPHTIARGLMANVGDWADVTLTDMEAGLEHLSRGTTEHADIMLVVAEPYFRSLATAGKAAELARDLRIPAVYLVGNKIRTDMDRQALQELAERKGLTLLARIPYDEKFLEAEQAGMAPLDFSPDSPAVRETRRLAQELERLGGE